MTELKIGQRVIHKCGAIVELIEINSTNMVKYKVLRANVVSGYIFILDEECWSCEMSVSRSWNDQGNYNLLLGQDKPA